MRGSRGIPARDSSAACGVFAGFDVHRTAGRRAGQARPLINKRFLLNERSSRPFNRTGETLVPPLPAVRGNGDTRATSPIVAFRVDDGGAPAG